MHLKAPKLMLVWFIFSYTQGIQCANEICGIIKSKFKFRRNSNYWQTIDLGDVEALESFNFIPTRKTKIYGIGGDNDGSIANSTKDGIYNKSY